jgi:hypothetical protein
MLHPIDDADAVATPRAEVPLDQASRFLVEPRSASIDFGQAPASSRLSTISRNEDFASFSKGDEIFTVGRVESVVTRNQSRRE